jgi:4-amino-4-deoxy-L-arabinose transferase-like glycosyltransferase
MRHAIRSAVFPTLVLFGLCWLLFFHRLGERDLWSSHEGRAAQNAQSILDEGCWGLPRQFDRHLELQKPPLYYWLVAGLARLRGGPVDALGVRLPAALAALGVVGLLYFFGCWRGRPILGLAAGVIAATAHHFTWMARVGRIDMPLTLAVGLSLTCYYLARLRQGQRQSSWGYVLTAYLAMAAAFLLKGPIGIVLPVVVATAYLAMERQVPLPWQGRCWLRLIHELGLWWGLPLVVALISPWCIWADRQTNGSLFRTFFWYHNFERAFGGSGGLRAHPWWFYGPRLAADLMPWSLLVPAAAWYFLSRKRSAVEPDDNAWRSDPEARFGLVWLVSMVLVLSCARFKRADYLLPAYPGAALLLGCAVERWYATARHRRQLAVAGGLVALSCALGWWVYLDRVLPAREAAREHRRFAEEIRRHAPLPQLVLFFRVESHTLAFHIGSPIDTFLEWENLDIWAGRPQTNYIVMPLDCAAEWSRHVTSGRLEEVLRSTDLPGADHRDRPLVLMRTVPGRPAT